MSRVRKMKLGPVLLLLVGCVSMVIAEEVPPAATKVCEPGKEVTKDCGVCRCNAEGTEYTCGKECTETQKLPQVLSGSEEKCTPGEVFKQGCNECKCPDSGMRAQAACTIIGCPAE